MSVCMNDIELYMEHADGYNCLRHDPEEGRDDGDEEDNIFDEEDHEKFIVRRVATLFPRVLETLILWDRPGDGIAEQIEQGLVKMLQSGRYPNLKAVFLEATKKPLDEISPRIEQSGFQEAVNAGNDAGVDLYTLSDQEGMQHAVDFVEAPDEYDLKSGIYAGARPVDWVFDPYLGRRVPPHHKAEQYAALWERLKSAREAAWTAQKIIYTNGEDVIIE